MPVGWVAPLFRIQEVLDLDLDSHAEGFMSSSVYRGKCRDNDCNLTLNDCLVVNKQINKWEK